MQLVLPWDKIGVLDDVVFYQTSLSACLGQLSKEFEALMTFIISDTDVCWN